jgi:integrase
VWRRTTVDGQLVIDLPWSRATADWAEQYRQVREATPKQARGKAVRGGGTIKASTVNRELGTVQTMLNYFVDVRKTIPRNPIDGFHRVDEAGNARQTFLSQDQVRRLIEAGPPVFQDICWVAYRCAGMRHTEVRLLQKDEIDWDARVINLPAARNKNGRARAIPFPQDVEEILARHCAGSRGPLVFVAPTDPMRMKPVPRQTMINWMQKARAKSGLRGFAGEAVVIHTLRHSGVTQLIQDGGREGFVRSAAGMSAKTLERYLKFGREQQDKLREVMDRQNIPPTPIAGEQRPARRSSGPALIVPGRKRNN